MVVFFHVFTRILFPIGVFPYVMIISSLIFFDNKFHITIIKKIKKIISSIYLNTVKLKIVNANSTYNKFSLTVVLIFFIIQLLMPIRHMLYPGNIMWHEQGYRFSWRVMLMEKIGYTTFKIEQENGKYFYVNNEEHLTSYQEKQMSFQPDFILEYAHYLGQYYHKKGYDNIKVFADSYVSLNGRKSQRYIDNNIDILNINDSFKNKTWILPLKND